MTDAPKEFIDWFENLRKERGWGIRDAARVIGVSHPTISEISTYGKQPSFDTCVALANTFEVSPVWVMVLAGLLPEETKNGYDLIIKNVVHQMGQMDDVDKKEINDFTEMIFRRRKQRNLVEEFEARLAVLPENQRNEIVRDFYSLLTALGGKRLK